MRITTVTILTFILFSIMGGAIAAQTRVSDKDIETMMKNLNEDAKKFTSSFNSVIGKSSIRKTSREKESKQLVKRFEEQTAVMYKNFRKNKKADSEVKRVLASADEITQLLEEVNLEGQATVAWKKVKDELDLVSKSFGVTE